MDAESRRGVARGYPASHGTSRRRMEARGHLAAGLPAPRRPRRHRGAAEGPLPRRGGAQAHRPGLRARAARRRAGLLGAPGPGAAAAHLGPAPPELQRPRPRGRARPLHDAVPVRQRRDDRDRPPGRGRQLRARADPRRRRPPRRARPRGRARALRPRALPDRDAHPAAARIGRAAAAARRAAAAGHPARAAGVVPRRRAQLRPRRRARHPRPDGRLPRAHGHLGRRGLRGAQPRRLHRPGDGLQRGRQGPREAHAADGRHGPDAPDARAPRARCCSSGCARASYDRIVGGDYIRRGHEPPLRDEADAAQEHYAKRVSDAFQQAGSSINEVGQQLGDWLSRQRAAAARDDE